MKSVNRVELKGNVGGDPRVNTVDGRTVVNFSLATDNSWKDKQGEWHNDTDWHNVCAWGGFGIADADRIHSGSKVHVVGKLRTRKYSDRDGQERYVTEVLAEELDIIDEPAKEQDNGDMPRSAFRGQTQSAQRPSHAAQRRDNDDDF